MLNINVAWDLLICVMHKDLKADIYDIIMSLVLVNLLSVLFAYACIFIVLNPYSIL